MELLNHKGYTSDEIKDLMKRKDDVNLYTSEIENCIIKDVDNNLIVFTNTPEPTPVKTGSFMIYIVVISILSVGLVTYYVIKKQIV